MNPYRRSSNIKCAVQWASARCARSVAIVAEEQQADAKKANVLRWFVRYGWIVLPCIALLVAYAMGLI